MLERTATMRQNRTIFSRPYFRHHHIKWIRIAKWWRKTRKEVGQKDKKKRQHDTTTTMRQGQTIFAQPLLPTPPQKKWGWIAWWWRETRKEVLKGYQSRSISTIIMCQCLSYSAATHTFTSILALSLSLALSLCVCIFVSVCFAVLFLYSFSDCLWPFHTLPHTHTELKKETEQTHTQSWSPLIIRFCSSSLFFLNPNTPPRSHIQAVSCCISQLFLWRLDSGLCRIVATDTMGELGFGGRRNAREDYWSWDAFVNFTLSYFFLSLFFSK